jgi:integrase
VSRPYKPTVTTYQLPDGKHRTADGRRVTKSTPGAVRVSRKSAVWYGKFNDAEGRTRRVPLCRDRTASKQMLAKLMTDAKLGELGLVDIYEVHHKKPLLMHLSDFEAHLQAKGVTAKQIKLVIGRARRVIEGCGFQFIRDLDALRVQTFTADLADSQRPRITLEIGKEQFTKREVAAVLGVKIATVGALVRRLRLAAWGNGKARRYPRVTVEALQERLCRGKSVQTRNFYLAAVRQLAGWLVKSRRMRSNPLACLEAGNPDLDRRHDRRPLCENELRLLLEMTRQSIAGFRGLSGEDRHLLYVLACVTGFRARELAMITPKSFDLEFDPPIVSVRAGYTKNRKLAVQPLPADVAASFRQYLRAKGSGTAVWPGSWYERAADMLCRDLEACGIPYVIEGPDGPLFADFHALRHSYVRLLDQSGATLKEAMQLARHSDPKLTMARYGRAQLHDLGAAIDRLPSLMLVDRKRGQAAAATGTAARRRPRLDQTGALLCNSVTTVEESRLSHAGSSMVRKPRKTRQLITIDSAIERLSEVPPAGFEPATYGLGNRRSIP